MDEIKKEKPSSIEVNKNAKGDYSFHVKTYYDTNEEDWIDIVNRTENIYDDLERKFGNR